MVLGANRQGLSHKFCLFYQMVRHRIVLALALTPGMMTLSMSLNTSSQLSGSVGASVGISLCRKPSDKRTPITCVSKLHIFGFIKCITSAEVVVFVAACVCRRVCKITQKAMGRF